MRRINLAKRAQKFIKKLPSKHARQVALKIYSLSKEPYPQDSKKLVNMDFYRVDSGEYRIIYEVISETIMVYLVGKRNDGEVYRQAQRLKKS